jgi:alpha-glucosidase
LVREALEQWPAESGMGWPSWALSNHDAPRWLSRWAPQGHEDEFARVIMMMFACLRGNIILWQGEELGLSQVNIPFELLQDPEAIANWPHGQSRDGARTPMPWTHDATHCGFSKVQPWLPLGDDHSAKAVDLQDADPDSLLELTRHLIAFRQSHQALLVGDLRVIEASQSLLVFERHSGGDHFLCVFNFGEEDVDWAPPRADPWRVLESVGGGQIGSVPAFGALIAQRSD